MLKVGLTGGIGSGKTLVASIFEVLGIPVFNADVETKSLMETDQQLVEGITQTFGNETYDNGKLNRQYLASIVFNHPYKLEQLNALVHPSAIKAANTWAAKQSAPYVIKEAALLFEAGSTTNLDFVIGVYAPQTIRLKRAMSRDNVSREEVLARMSRQISDVIKMRLCDFVITNDDQQAILPQVLQLHNQFLQKVRNLDPS